MAQSSLLHDLTFRAPNSIHTPSPSPDPRRRGLVAYSLTGREGLGSDICLRDSVSSKLQFA